MSEQKPPSALKPKDYATDQEVRWCPGCGDYAILKGVQKTLADVEADPAKTVFISGIGCAARFPYYMETYGFHTIHGRAAAVATGTKLANPDLDIWVVGGDGDSLSIGGNHLMHLLRRDVNLQYLLFNNEIYGLTKGQASPTSRAGTRSPSTPRGSIDRPVNAARFALGAGARFVARTGDVMQAHLIEVLKQARAHRGTGFVEILQNCIVYNDNVFGAVMDKPVQAEAQILLEQGAPLLFGAAKDKGLRLKPGTLALEVVPVGGDGHGIEDILVHDETDRALAALLAEMEGPDFPVAMGVIYRDPGETLDTAVVARREQSVTDAADPAGHPLAALEDMLHKGHTWVVS